MSRSIVCYTQKMYTLSLNIYTRDNGRATLTAIPILPLTAVIFALWSARRQVARHWEIMREGVEVGKSGCEWVVGMVSGRLLDGCEGFYVGVNGVLCLTGVIHC